MEGYEICNYTLQRKIRGMPDAFLGSSGFVRLTRSVPGMRFVKKKNDQVNMVIDAHAFVPAGMPRPWRASLHRVILSNCSDRAVVMKVLGVKCKSKVVFIFRVFQSILGAVEDPATGAPLRSLLSYGPVETTNVVAKWRIPRPLLSDFELMRMEFGERCSFQMSKIPLMRMKHPALREGGKRLSVNVSLSGMCTTLGVKDPGEIPERQRSVRGFFERIQSMRGRAPGGLAPVEQRSCAQREAESDRLNFAKSEPYFRCPGSGAGRVRYFNKSEYRQPARARDPQWAQQLPRKLPLYVQRARRAGRLFRE